MLSSHNTCKDTHTHTQPVTFFNTIQTLCMDARKMRFKANWKDIDLIFLFEFIHFSEFFFRFSLSLNCTIRERAWFNICMPIATQPNRTSNAHLWHKIVFFWIKVNKYTFFVPFLLRLYLTHKRVNGGFESV